MGDNKSEIIIYQSEDGLTCIDVRMEDETVWLTQAQLVDLYQTSKANISEHIKHIFEDGELDESSVVRNFRTTTFSSNSPSLKILEICSLIVALLLLNKAPICS